MSADTKQHANLPEGWSSESFSDAIVPVKADRAKQVQANTYLSQGKYPVVDQGQKLIAGGTNDESTVLADELPLVVFGDHTRVFKYIDFPFAVGADGTKLIKPKSHFHPRYFYYQLLHLDIPSKGYSRHYRLLKEKEIRYPSFPEQKRIAAVLLKIQKAIEIQGKIIETMRELKKSTMQHVFTHGLRGEKTKQTDIGEIPESWNVEPLSEYREFLQYGTSKRCTLEEKGIAVLRIPNIVGGVVDATKLKYADISGREREKLLLRIGDILFVRTNGQRKLVGRCAVYNGEPAPALFASYLIRARLHQNRLRPDFLRLYTDTKAGSAGLSGRATPAADGKFNINTKIIDSALVPIPEPAEQDGIVKQLTTIQSKISLHERRKVILQELFKTMLNNLMTGEIRVKDLDIDISEVEI